MTRTWKEIWSKRHSVRLSESWLYGALNFEEFWGMPFPAQKIVIQDSFGKGFVDEKEYEAVHLHFLNRIESESFDVLFKNGEPAYQEFLTFARTFKEQDFSNLSDKDLLEKFRELLEREDYWMHFMWPIFILDEIITRKLGEFLTGKDDETKNEFLKCILTLPKKTAVGQYKADIQELTKKNLSGPGLEKEIESIAKKYSFFPVLNMDEGDFGREAVRIEYENALKDGSDNTFPVAGVQKEIEAKYEDLTKNLPAKEKNLLDAAKRVVYLREYRNDIRQEAYLDIKRFYEEIARRSGLNIADIIYCTRGEIADFLSGKSKLPAKQDIVRRRQYSEMLCENGKVIYSWNKAADSQSKEKEDTGNEIKGVIAFKGKVTGIAKIILNIKEDAPKFNDGDILVSTTTNLYFVPLMTKARAIVTNEGGLLTHTAIVARELSKPCIVGTKNATKVIKDGMEIEVDADKGVVRIVGQSK